jgi:hypothetical protein
MQGVVQAGVLLLEALAAVLAARTPPAENGAAGEEKEPPALLGSLVTADARSGKPVLQLPVPPPEVLQRGAAALQAILRGLNGERPG